MNPTTTPPNILLLVMDSVRAANLSCYGYSRATTPNLDRFAAQSTLYEQAISVGCWTLPVHASLFTGLYPLGHGVTISRAALPENFPTLARRLTALGYQTACFSNNAYISEATGLTQGFETVEDVWRITHPRGIQRPKLSKTLRQLESRGRLARPLVGLVHGLMRVRSGLSEWRNRADRGARLTHLKIRHWLTHVRRPEAPFFIFVNYMECHERYRPPYPYNRRFMPARVSPWRMAQLGTLKSDLQAMSGRRRAEDLEILRALYDGSLRYLDDQIGELIRFVETAGLSNDTLIVVTSDHGDLLGEHNQLGHRLTLYEPLVRVPLIVRYPPPLSSAPQRAAHWGPSAPEPAGQGGAAPGARVTRQVQLGDLFPTVLELAGEADASAGTAFHSLLAPADAAPRPFTVAENTAPKSQNGLQQRMVRTERYKYIWKSNDQHELYDLAHDPTEATNLIDSLPDVASRMIGHLQNWERGLDGQRLETREVEYDEEVLERLRALGYLG